MPQKTRKQKILAQQYFQTRLVNQSLVPSLSGGKKIVIPSSPYQVDESHETMIRHYFLVDFKKSLILIVGIIALEIFIYFVSMRSNWLGSYLFFKVAEGR